MRARRAAVGVALFIVLAAGCGDKDEPSALSGDATAAMCGEAAWSAGVQPLVSNNCTGCHATTLTGAARSGAPASVNFDSYAEAVANAERGNARLGAGTMPPSGGLADADRALFQSWLTAGTPEDPSCAAAGDTAGSL